MLRITRTIEFIETSVFTQQIRAMATDDELRKLQLELIANPAKGAMITGTGGLRKVRMAQEKGGKATLSDTEKSQLRALTQQLKREA